MQKIIREILFIDDMQFGPHACKTDTIFIFRQLQEKHLAKNREL